MDERRTPCVRLTLVAITVAIETNHGLTWFNSSVNGYDIKLESGWALDTASDPRCATTIFESKSKCKRLQRACEDKVEQLNQKLPYSVYFSYFI